MTRNEAPALQGQQPAICIEGALSTSARGFHAEQPYFKKPQGAPRAGQGVSSVLSPCFDAA